MRLYDTDPLFAWERLDDSPTLSTLRDLLHALPDAQLLKALRRHRGRGRNDHPVHALWGVAVLSVALRHTTTQATLDELRRNPTLRRLIGIGDEADVPDAWNLSRFYEVLGQEPHRTLVREMFDTLVRRLAGAVNDLGARAAGDATALRARAADAADAAAAEEGLPRPCGGRKEYLDESGQVTRVVEWFGYKLHLIVDARHEVILAWSVTSAGVADNLALPPLLGAALANLPAGRMQSLAYDKAADDAKVHEHLAGAGVKPLIQNRALWKNEHERVLEGKGVNHNIVYDEAGTVYCYDTVSSPPLRQPMAYIGHEAQRGTLKYRCPARHMAVACPAEKLCNAGKTYGLTVRVKQDIDLRRFPPIPRATQQFERLYKGRTAVERVNARVKLFWGADDGNFAGPRRFVAHVGVVMLAHAAFATLLARSPRREGSLSKTRLSAVAKALATPAPG